MPPSARATRHAQGFTLIELLLAVTLLVLIVLVSSYIFDTTMRAVSQTQANNELNMTLEAFSEILRIDMRGLEHDGMLVFGRRVRPSPEQVARGEHVFGSQKDRANRVLRTYCVDWMSFFTCTEQYSAVDPRVISVRARTFYGHGRMADPKDSDFSNLATDWVLLRHQIVTMPKPKLSVAETDAAARDYYTTVTVQAMEFDGMSDYVGNWRQYERSILSYWVRDFRWYWYMNYGWEGDISVGYGGADGADKRTAFYEPEYYQDAYFYFGASAGRRFHLLPHCAEFKVQYAMPEDVSVGPGGCTLWRDPPAVGESNYPDPNYNPAFPYDVMHRQQKIRDGRLAFGPGDRWPALIRLTAHIFDPLQRLDGGRRYTAVFAVP